jgi:hypothetical protein
MFPLEWCRSPASISMHRMSNSQCRQVLLREAVLFVTPFMQALAIMISTRLRTQEAHTILGSPVTCPHGFSAAAGRGSAIDSSNGSRGIFAPMICDVEAHDSSAATRRGALHEQYLRDLAILAKILGGAQCRDELVAHRTQHHHENDAKTQTSSLANRGPIPTT